MSWTLILTRACRLGGCMRSAETAELFIIDQLVDRGLFSAKRATRVFSQIQGRYFHRKRIEVKQLADESVPFAENQFDGFQSLDDSDESRQYS